MNPEFVNPNEQLPSTPGLAELESKSSELTPDFAEEMFAQRLAKAQELQPFISLKFFYFLKEKVVREQAAARKLLKIEENKQEVLDKYSFVLNPAYFEQKTLS